MTKSDERYEHFKRHQDAARAMLVALKAEMALVGRLDISGTAFLLACTDAHKASRAAIAQAEAAGIRVEG